MAGRTPGSHDPHGHADHRVGDVGLQNTPEHVRLGRQTTGQCRKESIRASLEFSGVNELISFMEKSLVLRYKWLPDLKLSDESKRGLDWLSDERNRSVGPVEWEHVRVNKNVSALEPSIITPE